jgi:hypothetical protein
MIIIEIALGVVLGVILIAFLPEIMCWIIDVAIWLICAALLVGALWLIFVAVQHVHELSDEVIRAIVSAPEWLFTWPNLSLLLGIGYLVAMAYLGNAYRRRRESR